MDHGTDFMQNEDYYRNEDWEGLFRVTEVEIMKFSSSYGISSLLSGFYQCVKYNKLNMNQNVILNTDRELAIDECRKGLTEPETSHAGALPTKIVKMGLD